MVIPFSLEVVADRCFAIHFSPDSEPHASSRNSSSRRSLIAFLENWVKPEIDCPITARNRSKSLFVGLVW
jgi:hypothetical protein